MKLSKSKYNRLSIETEPYYLLIKGRKRWFIQVICDCGERRTVRAEDLKNNKVKSCGCLFLETSKKNIKTYNKKLAEGLLENPNKTHGDSGSAFYSIWNAINQRCGNPSYEKYHRYGGRGIKVLWISYEDFKKDMYSSYLLHKKQNKHTSIDRINLNKNYSKDNCRWADATEQANNTSRNRTIRYRGKSQTVSQWSRESGIPRSTINARIHTQKLTRPSSILKI